MEDLRTELVEMLNANTMHKNMLNGLDKEYEEVNDDIDKTLSGDEYNKYNFDYGNGGKDASQELNTAGTNTREETVNRIGWATLLQLWRLQRNHEKSYFNRMINDAIIQQEKKEKTTRQ